MLLQQSVTVLTDQRVSLNSIKVMNIGTTSNRRGTPAPPEKGSFPLDHDAECKIATKIYLQCLDKHELQVGNCKQEMRQYFQCRMDRYFT